MKKEQKMKLRNNNKNNAGGQITFKRFAVLGLVSMLIMLYSAAIDFYLMEFMIRNPFEKIKPELHIVNIVFFLISIFMVFSVVGSLRISLLFSTALSVLVGLLDYFVLKFKSTPIQPADIYSIKVAASVMGDYEWELTKKLKIIIGIALLACICSFFIKIKLPSLKKGKKAVAARLIMVFVSIALMFGYVKYVQSEKFIKKYNVYDKLFTPTTMTFRDGTMVAYLMQWKYMFVTKPVGYSEKAALALLNNDATEENAEEAEKNINNIDSTAEEGTGQEKPDIIVIMNEAFSDLSVLQDYETNIEVMPFFDTMKKGYMNTITGVLDVDVLGGNTANTEFEFLTGHTMRFYPMGSVPYQQYIHKRTDSLVWLLKENGYSATALHPYGRTGWNRDKVYEYLGFDEYISEEGFEGRKTLRKYISDMGDYEKLLEVYREKQKDGPVFLFNVTMQNHSGYGDDYKNFSPEVEVQRPENSKIKFDDVNKYLSLIRESDAALSKLIDELINEDRHIILVFFGDHQPNNSTVAPLYKLNDKDVNSIAQGDIYKRYQVPLIIWSNHKMQEGSLNTSPGFLGLKTLELAGIKLNNYYSFLKTIYSETNSVNIYKTELSNRTDVVESQERIKETLNKYNIVQYYKMFGEK